MPSNFAIMNILYLRKDTCTQIEIALTTKSLWVLLHYPFTMTQLLATLKQDIEITAWRDQLHQPHKLSLLQAQQVLVGKKDRWVFCWPKRKKKRKKEKKSMLPIHHCTSSTQSERISKVFLNHFRKMRACVSMAAAKSPMVSPAVSIVATGFLG